VDVSGKQSEPIVDWLAVIVRSQFASVLVGDYLYGSSGQGVMCVEFKTGTIKWDFSSPSLAMNIFLPDPVLRGLWDWRSPFYLQVKQDPAAPLVQPQVIDFLKTTAWVQFIIEYHKDVPFVGILPAAIPDYPIFNRKHTLPPNT
jgi:hypothetical protein